jgi:hypothetical protein
VQLKLGTRQRKDSMYKEGRDKAESTGCSVQSEFQVKQKVHTCSPLGRVTCECWGPVGPWLRKKVNIQEENED